MTGSEKGLNSMASGAGSETGQPHGRHRHGSGTWTPRVAAAHPPSHAQPPAAPPPPTELEPVSDVETTVPGLHKFDLGSIPASVTPPRTWRKAAWFAIGSSAAVVAGMVFAASALMGKPKNTDTIDALPGFPSMPIELESSGAQNPVIGPSRTRPPTSRPGERPSNEADPSRTPGAGPSTGIPTITGWPVPTGVPGSSSPGRETTPPAPPVRETTPKRALAMSEPAELGDRTEAFYQQVVDDPAAAYSMTTGSMRLQGEEAFRQRYAGVEEIEVKRIGIDPNSGTTVSEVKITKVDGSSVTERRRLQFSRGEDPKISSEVTH